MSTIILRTKVSHDLPITGREIWSCPSQGIRFGPNFFLSFTGHKIWSCPSQGIRFGHLFLLSFTGHNIWSCPSQGVRFGHLFFWLFRRFFGWRSSKIWYFSTRYMCRIPRCTSHTPGPFIGCCHPHVSSPPKRFLGGCSSPFMRLAPTPRGASRLVITISAWSVKTRRASPSWHCRDMRGSIVIRLRPAVHGMRTPHLGLGLFSMADTSAVGGAVGGRKGGRFWKRPAGSFPKTLVAIGVWHSYLGCRAVEL